MRALMMLGLMSCLLMPSFSIDNGEGGGGESDQPQSGGDSSQTLGNTEGNPLDEAAGEGANEAAEQGNDSDAGDDGDDGSDNDDEPDGFEDDGA